VRWLGGVLLIGIISMVLWQIGASKRTVSVRFERVTVQAEVARSEEEQVRGLAGHSPLGPSDGMLFPYDSPTRPTFWMKGVTFPIDLIWIQGGTVVGYEGEMPTDDGAQQYPAPSAVDAVLEVRSGFVREHGIAVGDPVDLGLQ
jgi:uncharacterized membrane protein (UPF0127 family)